MNRAPDTAILSFALDCASILLRTFVRVHKRRSWESCYDNEDLGRWSFSPAGLILPLILITRRMHKPPKASLQATWSTARARLWKAQVSSLPLTITGTTDNVGEFTLPDVPAGHYTLTVSYVGFKTYNQEVEVTAGQTLNLTITLPWHRERGDSGHRRAPARRSRSHQQNAHRRQHHPDVLPSEVITSLPNANVADALGRLPRLCSIASRAKACTFRFAAPSPA